MCERRILTTIGACLICCAGCGDEGHVGVQERASSQQAYFAVKWLPTQSICKKGASGALSCVAVDGGHTLSPQAISGAAEVIETKSEKVDPRLQVDVELPLESGSTFHLLLDLPAGDDDGATAVPKVSYSESGARGKKTFLAASAAGRMQRKRSECGCRDLGLDLLFIDSGVDQIVSTADDEYRHLRLGHLRFGNACLDPGLFPVTPTYKLHLDLLSCGDAGSPTGPSPGPGRSDAGTDGVPPYTPPSNPGSGGGSGYSLPDSPSGGCEGGGGGGYSGDTSGGGCEGDSGGCEGDSGGCDGDMGGCEGDMGGGCEGDMGGGGCEGDMGGGDCAGDIGGGADCGGGGGAACRFAGKGGKRLRINTLPVWLLLLLAVYGVGRLRRRR